MNLHILVMYFMFSVCIYNAEHSKDEEETSVAELFTGSLSTSNRAVWYVRV